MAAHFHILTKTTAFGIAAPALAAARSRRDGGNAMSVCDDRTAGETYALVARCLR